MLSYDLKMIKDKYGEKMMHLCRTLFPSLLEHEGLLFKILSEHFDFNKELYDDIMPSPDYYGDFVDAFKNFIYSLVDVESMEEVIEEKSPEELLDEAGYILYECHSEEDIQSFLKYYAPGEALCTFNGGRLNRCFVFFAVKKDVDKILRFDFKAPRREDEYGTSVISIQFSKGEVNTLSIKNRYNHTVNNPDATFSNNLDNIIPGLTKAFEKKYGFNITFNEYSFVLPGYVLANDGKFYKYNYEVNNVYYCPNNIIIDNFEVKKYDKAKYIVLDNYIIDKVKKTIELYDKKIVDPFVSTIGKIEKIEEKIDKEKNERIIIINDSIIITIDKHNQIVSYSNSNIEEIGSNFMKYNAELKSINIPNVKKIGNYFLENNYRLETFDALLLKEIGNHFLEINREMKTINIPNVEYIGDKFLSNNTELKEILMPKLKQVGNDFLYDNKIIDKIIMPELRQVGYSFLADNQQIKSIDFPLLEKVGDAFLLTAPITSINMPSIREVGSFFLSGCKMTELTIDSLKTIGEWFMRDNTEMKSLSLPNVEIIGNGFLIFNRVMSYLNLPKVKKIGRNFLQDNVIMKELYLPELEIFDSTAAFYYRQNSVFGEVPITIYVPKYKGTEFDKIQSETLIVVKGEPFDEENESSKKRGL